jgi:hypothetical protein
MPSPGIKVTSFFPFGITTYFIVAPLPPDCSIAGGLPSPIGHHTRETGPLSTAGLLLPLLEVIAILV